MINSYRSGSLVRSTAKFVNDEGVLTDPSTTTFKYRKGAGSTTTVTGDDLTHDSEGVFHYDLDTTGWAGPDTQLWLLEWIGTGEVVAITDDSFEVTPPVL